MGWLDLARGARSWQEGLSWLAEVAQDRSLGEIHYWGHGKWGYALIGDETLRASSLHSDHPHFPLLLKIRARLPGSDALWWFRTCETFGCIPGKRFAEEWSSFFNCRAAGHTFIIGPLQSGLHSIKAGQIASWPDEEGLACGTSAAPEKTHGSGFHHPNTITFLHHRVPEGF